MMSRVLTGEMKKLNECMFGLNTIGGWTAMGRPDKPLCICTTTDCGALDTGVTDMDEFDRLLRRFWELELQ